MNATDVILFRVNNEQLNDIIPEQPIDKEEFKRIYKIATREKPWHFLYINNRKNPEKRYYKNFTVKPIK